MNLAYSYRRILQRTELPLNGMRLMRLYLAPISSRSTLLTNCLDTEMECSLATASQTWLALIRPCGDDSRSSDSFSVARSFRRRAFSFFALSSSQC